MRYIGEEIWVGDAVGEAMQYKTNDYTYVCKVQLILPSILVEIHFESYNIMVMIDPVFCLKGLALMVRNKLSDLVTRTDLID